MIALRQSYIANAKTLSSIAVQAGDLVLVGLYQDGVQVATSCADSGGNTYSKAAEQHITDGAGCGVYLYYTVAGATGSLTITGTMAGSGYNSIFVHVYSGTFNLATTLHAFQTKGETVRSTSHTSAEVTTTTPNALLFCLWGEPSGSGTIAENGTGFMERQEDAGTASCDRIVSAAGTYSDAVTSTVSTALASILAAFQEVQSSSGPWRGVFPGTWQPSDAAFTSTPPGMLVAEVMLGPVATGIHLSATGAGGATSSGSATFAKAFLASVSGGATASGTAAFSGTFARSDSFTGSGGATASGAAAFSKAFMASISGGATSSGAATFTKTLVGSISGGATPGGAAVSSKALRVTTTGGATASGSADFAMQGAARNDEFTGAGGATASGSAIASRGLVASSSGGATAGGSALTGRILRFTGAGGALASGVAAASMALAWIGSGGAVGSGEAIYESSNRLTTDPRYLLTVPRRTFALAVPARSFTLQAAYRSFSLAKPTPDRSIVLPARSFEVTL